MDKRKNKSYRRRATLCIVVAFAAAAVAMLVWGLLLRAELTELNGEISKLSTELSELDDEKRRLEIRLEESTDLAAIEDYARNVLGMQQPEPGQIIPIDTDAEDYGEMLSDGTDSSDEETEDWISSLPEYFGLG